MPSARAVLIALSLLVPATVAAAEQELPVSLTFGHHAVALPPGGIAAPGGLQPGVVAGTELTYTRGRAGRLCQDFDLGVLTSDTLGTTLRVASHLVYRSPSLRGLWVDVSLGHGYLHNFHPRPIYRQGDDGKYESARDGGRATGMMAVAVSAGYDLVRRPRRPVSLFVRYEWFLQSPYFDATLPVMPQSLVSAGVRVGWRRQP